MIITTANRGGGKIQSSKTRGNCKCSNSQMYKIVNDGIMNGKVRINNIKIVNITPPLNQYLLFVCIFLN